MDATVSTFTLELDIQADQEAVLAFVADFATTPLWYSAVQQVERISGEGAGARYSVHRRLPVGPVVNTVEVIGYEDGREVAFASVDGPTPFRYRYRIRPEGRGTRLELDAAISAAGLPGPARLLGPLAGRLFKNGMRDNLVTLKRLIEAG
jgi:carbon monoxide dehydrogenase subunit G